MAISNIANPNQRYMTGYNPIVFVVDSDNKNAEGFRYIFDIYSAGTSNLLASYQIAPRINDGYGVLFAEKVLQNYLSYNFGTSEIRDSWINYDVKVGESYGSNWTYNDYQFFSATGTTNNGYTELYNTGTTHTYVAGDQINIVQSDEPNPAFPQLSGLHTVRFVPNANSIVIDLVFVYTNPGVLISGTTTYADNARVVNRDLFTYSANTAFNGAVSFIGKKFPQEKYVISGTTDNKLFLTTSPLTTCHTVYEDLYFNIINNNANTAFYLYARNSNGELYRVQILDTSEPLIQLPVGPNNIGVAPIGTSTFPLIKDNTEFYDIYIANSAGQRRSALIRICIDRRCIIDYGTDNGGNISICFLDRLGSFGSFAFQLKKNDTTQIERQSYNKQSGFISSNQWDYSVLDNGTNIYNVDLKRSVTLNTNWMEEGDAQWFDELVSSPVTFIKWNNSYQRCDIQDVQTERSYQRNKRLMRKTITVNFSNNDNINI
jgi:hypothetical protein